MSLTLHTNTGAAAAVSTTNQTARAFGRSVGFVLTLLAGYHLWRERIVAANVCAMLGAFLFIAGTWRPAMLRVPSEWWWRMARALGWVNAHVLLTGLFLLVITPLGLVRRTLGHDPLRRRHQPQQSGWVPSPERLQDPAHYTRMY